VKFGLRLPTWAFATAPHESYQLVAEFAQRADRLGFDALWVVEHLLTAPGLYGASWLEQLDRWVEESSPTSPERTPCSVRPSRVASGP